MFDHITNIVQHQKTQPPNTCLCSASEACSKKFLYTSVAGFFFSPAPLLLNERPRVEKKKLEKKTRITTNEKKQKGTLIN